MRTGKLRRFSLEVSVLLLAVALEAAAEGKIWEFEHLWSGPRAPMIDVSYGFGPVKQRLFQGNFADFSSVELKLGYMRAWQNRESTAKINDKFVVFNYSASDLFGKSVAPTETGSTLIRFGTGAREGYAYDFASTYLFPYTQTTMLWTKVDTKRPAGLSTAAEGILDRYEGTFRFGAAAEGGLAFGFGESVALRLGYEATVIYPRYVLWPWLGSTALAGIGMGAVSHFGKNIVEASPATGPIIYALLRAGLAYGYYLLVRDNQYWPFRSETPLTTESLKVGVTLTF